MSATIEIGTLVKEVDELHDSYPAWTLDNAFVHWFVQAFLEPDRDGAAKSVTGVSHDKGVDAILIDESLSKVFVLQGKFRRGPKPPLESRPQVIAFAQIGPKLLGAADVFRSYKESIDPLVAQRLDEARNRLKRRKYELHLYFVTTGRCSAPLKAEAESEVSQANGRATITVLDRSDILSLLVDYLGGAAPPVPFLDLRIDGRGVVGADGVVQRYDAENQIESWILSVSAKDVADLYKRAGDRLFARNIRGFLGDTAINEGMAETLSCEPRNFWYFNNGITIVCDSARKTSERGTAILRVNNPQVINGQQTTRTVHRLPSKNASVLVKVISVARGQTRSHEQFESLVSSIVAATNWQNAIRPSDLRSNDQRQVALQRDLAKLGYHYLRKRQTKKEAKRASGKQYAFWIKKEELAQVTGACEFDPVSVRRGKEGLFKKPYYDEVFDNRPVREYLTIYWLGRVVKRVGSGYPDRAYAKWHALNFVWSDLAGTFRSTRAADTFRRRCERGKWPPDLERAVDQVYRAMLEFYKARKGKGAHAIDVSNFFYRPNQHLAFKKYWRGKANKRRKRYKSFTKRFQDSLSDVDA